MCENCKDIILRDSFYSPVDYLNCLGYMKELIEIGRLNLVKKTCDWDKVKDANGHWHGDIIEHVVQCEKCGKLFSCYSDTYHGYGNFKEVR